MKHNNKKPYFAEVVQSNLQTWTGQTWQWNNFPRFGSLVVAQHEQYKLYGIIYDITTGSSDSNRYVTTYQQNPAELMQQQPQLFEFLTTQFACIGIGYQEHDIFLPYLGPHPLPLHTFIAQASASDYDIILQSSHSIAQLSNHGASMQRCEEILLAFFMQAHNATTISPELLEHYIHMCSKILRHDFQRLKDFLEKLEIAVTQINPQLATLLQ